jgi:hypothetical protein
VLKNDTRGTNVRFSEMFDLATDEATSRIAVRKPVRSQ